MILQLVCMQIGHELLAAAGRTNTATSVVTLAERRTWFSNAARMFYNSPEGVTFAARWLLTSLLRKLQDSLPSDLQP